MTRPFPAPVVIELPKRIWFETQGYYTRSQSRWGAVRVERVVYDNTFFYVQGTATNAAGLGTHRREIEVDPDKDLPFDVAVFLATVLAQVVQEMANSNLPLLVTENGVYPAQDAS